MKRTLILLYSFVFLLFIIIGISAYTSEKSLTDILDVQLENIDKVIVSDQVEVGKYKQTSDSEQIQILINYLNDLTFTKLPGDETSYMPTKVVIIYLFERDKQDFIVAYETEAMINQKVYQINNGLIEDTFLNQYFQSLH